MQPETNLEDGANYKKKYKTLKRKLRMLIYEQECFAEELRRAQRKLLRISRDKSFLLDRLMQYEKPDQKESDSDATASSDSETEHGLPAKRKKASTVNTAAMHIPQEILAGLPMHAGSSKFGGPGPGTPQGKGKTFQKPGPIMVGQLSTLNATPDSAAAKKKAKAPKRPTSKGANKTAATASGGIIVSQPSQPSLTKTLQQFHLPSQPQQPSQQSQNTSAASSVLTGMAAGRTGILPVNIKGLPQQTVTLTSPTKQGQNPYLQQSLTRTLLTGQTITMTQEELERHLEMKQSNKSQFMSIEKTPMLPDNIFSNENSNSCDFPDSKTTDDEDLVIDMQ